MMSQLLIPFSILGRSLHGAAVNPWQSYGFILLCLTALWFGIKKMGKIRISQNELTYAAFFLVAILVTQAVGVMIASVVEPQFSFAPVVIFKTILKLLLQILAIWIVSIIAINSRHDVEKFFKGIDIAMWIILTIAILQLIYVQTHMDLALVNGIASLLEERGGSTTTGWYAAGSYVATTGRINGLKQETGFLAAQLLIVFVPLLLTKLKLREQFNGDKRMMFWDIWFPMALILIVLFQSGSTTGVIGIPVVLLIVILILVPKRGIAIFSIICVGFAISVLAAFVPAFGSILQKTIFDKFSFNNVSFVQRLGSAIAYLRIWVRSYLLGLGYGNTPLLGFTYAPNFMRSNVEFNTYWAIQGQGIFPVLSIVTGWLAQFGIIFVGLITFGMYRIVHLTTRWKQESEKMAEKNMFYYYFRYFLVFMALMSLMSFDWLHIMYLMLFFSLIRCFNILKHSENPDIPLGGNK